MSVRYTLHESLAGFKRNRMATFITIFTVSISLLLLGVFIVITVNLSDVVQRIRSRVELDAFLKDSYTAEQHQQVGRAIKAIPGVQSVRYISKEQAATDFKKDIGEDFYDFLDANPLPASFRITLAPSYANSDSANVIAARIKKMKAVDEVPYRKQFLSLIDKRAAAFKYATLFIGLVLGLSCIILVANTIRLTIYSKREIIRTMKLVGATSMFIRLPFLLEGVLHGFLGGIVASALIGVLFGFFIRPFAEDLMVTISINASYYLFLILLGTLLGFIGSILSIGRFLKEALVAA
jgi:cell division transport system permease protein